MRRLLPDLDARTVATVTSAAALALLATLIVLRRDDILGVVLALLLVLLTMTAGVSVTAARRQRETEPGWSSPLAPPTNGVGAIDADTVETLDRRETLWALEERRRQRR